MNFKDMKNKSGSTDFLRNKLEELNDNKKSYKDDRFWRPELDQASNGFAVIRFLPACEGEELPWVRIWNHGFQGPGGWYIENSLTTLGQKDPVSELNSKLWNSGTEQGKEIARKQKRRLQYIANIMVVSDPKNPDNEGKVFLYKFGKKIFDKIMESMNPEFQDETPVNPFDFWNGANFRLKVRKVAGFVNYDKSEFDSPTPLLDGDDEKLETLWNKQYALTEFTDPANFKTYDELKDRLEMVLGNNMEPGTPRTAETVETPFDTSTTEKPVSPDDETKVDEPEDNDSEDALSYFERLAAED
tara:strand:- start:2551 stop:3453 length:903 start_codon:yes stop_codon:yes gene_type:complete